MRHAFLYFFLLTLAAPAVADEVSIEWGKVEGTASYELQILRKKKTVMAKDFPASQTSWTGELPYGEYSYRIRSVSATGSAGLWSEPTPFVVTPGTPQLLIPFNRSVILFNSSLETSFRWSPVNGVKSFALEIKSQSGKVRREIVSEAKATLSGLPPGEFSWRVVPVLKTSKGRVQTLEAKASSTWTFRVESDEDNNSPDLDSNRLRLARSDGQNDLAVGEAVCLLETVKPISRLGCGKIIEVGKNGAVLRVSKAIPSLIDGKEYPVARRLASREVSSAPSIDSYVVSLERKKFNFEVGGGVVAGTQLLTFSAFAKTAVSPSLVLGLRAVVASDVSATTSAVLKGAFVTATYYLGRRTFSGFFAEGGAGGYLYDVTVDTQSENGRFSLGGYGVVGWQFRPSLWNLSLATAIGAQYSRKPSISISEVALSGLVPTLMLSASFAF